MSGGAEEIDVDTLPNAYGRQLSAEEIAAGAHRESVGGLWETVGALQFDLLVRRGLRPESKLLDIGCGCLRGGVHFIRYLEPGNYFGIDVNESLLAAGYEVELAAAQLQSRLPRSHLRATGSFEVSGFGEVFDFALAQSVFSHLPDAWLRRCLTELAPFMRTDGELYLTYFECPPDWPRERPMTYEPHGGTTFPDRDPFHYRSEDLKACAAGLPWSFERIGPWGHPRAQNLARFVRR